MGRPSHSAYAALPTTRDRSDSASSAAGDEAGSASGSRNHSRSGSTISHASQSVRRTAQHYDDLLSKWTHSISDKLAKQKHERMLKRQRRRALNGRDTDQAVPIIDSVFQLWVKQDGDSSDGEGKADKGKGKEKAAGAEVDVEWLTLDHEPPMSRREFDLLAGQVELAIEAGVHPRLNAKGSSGSYFAKDRDGKTVAIFKPKDEEPYGSLNPKFTKWVHRVFLSRIIPFGRACLIPQLSYQSEAAASLLDRRLETFIVPRTEVVSLSSAAFYYSYVDREHARQWKLGGNKGRPLPEKPGSFQVFMRGFKDASDFLREHPYPGRPLSHSLDEPKRRRQLDICSPFRFLCGKTDAEGEGPSAANSDGGDDEYEAGWGWGGEDGGAEERARRERKAGEFKWTEQTMSSFRLQLEKLVILDFLIRNTDRGLDNFMIKACTCQDGNATPKQQAHTTSRPPTPQPPMSSTGPAKQQQDQERKDPLSKPHMHIAAIDNSLAFPHQHPVGWRSYTYGWLFLPVSLIGQPFSNSTREHFLPLLSSPSWWAQTTLELRQLFALDPDFKESMFEKQMAVMKGQAYNVVQSLKHDKDGPLELCRRTKRLVHSDMVELRDDEHTRARIAATAAPPEKSRSRRSSTITAKDDDHHHRHDRHDGPAVEQQDTLPLPLVSTPRPTSPTFASDVSRFVGPTVSAPADPSNRPVPMTRVSSELKRPVARNGGRPFSTSVLPTTLAGRALSAAQVPKAQYGSVSGVSVLKALDRAEAEERGVRRGARSLNDDEFAEDDEDEDEGGDEGGESGELWGVRSEGGRSVDDVSQAVRATLSFDLDRSRTSYFEQLPTFEDGASRRQGLNRSGSLNELPVSAYASPRAKNGRAGGGAAHGRASSQAANSLSWNAPDEEDEDDLETEAEAGEGEAEGPSGRRIVVVKERIELVHENATFSWF